MLMNNDTRRFPGIIPAIHGLNVLYTILFTAKYTYLLNHNNNC